MAVSEERQQLSTAEVWHEVAAVALMVMELSWLAFWFAILYDMSITNLGETSVYLGDSFWRVFIVLGVVFGVGYGLARLFNILDVKVGFRRGAFVVMVLLSLWLGLLMLVRPQPGLETGSLITRVYETFKAGVGIPPEFWVLVAVMLVWRRAVGLAKSLVDMQTVLLSYQFGIMTLLLSEFFPPVVTNAVGFHPIFPFIFMGLFAMGAARIADINGLRGSKMAHFDRTWLLALVGGALLVVLVGALLAGLLNGWLGKQLGFLILVIMSIIGGLTLIVIYPLLQLMIEIIAYLQERMSQMEAFAPLSNMMEQVQKWAANQGKTALETIERVARPFALWGALILLALATLWAIRMRQRLASSARERGQVKVSAQDLLRELRDEARKRAQEALDALARRLNLRQAARLIQAARIRWVYRQLEDLCTDLGSPRPAAATPLEFLDKLRSLFPTAPQALDEIIYAYLKVRYGELPETSADVERVIDAWELVRGLGQRELAERKKNPK